MPTSGFHPDDLDAATSFPHEVTKFEVLQTHISWIVLTGAIAYKLKKPVKFDFLDFSTLELRRHFCQRELEINQRFAPQLYHDVVAITREPNRLVVGGTGEIVDYAVRMTQFPQAALLDRQLKGNAIDVSDMDILAEQIARYHADADAIRLDDTEVLSRRLVAPMVDNFSYFRDHLKSAQEAPLRTLQQWTTDQIQRLEPVLKARVAGGFIRECHGDLHLGNLLYWQDRFLAFDAIEFNDEFRQIDTMNELAFLVMDLDDRGYTAWSRRLLNHYLEVTGDYGGLQVLRLYMVYRALVRAKVDLIQRLQQSGDMRGQISNAGWDYVEHALRYANPQQPVLTITHGLSGSGKRLRARNCIQQLGAILLRSDVLRQRLPTPTETVERGALNEGRYSESMTQQTYQRMEQLSRDIMAAGYSVVVDATFLHRRQRDQFRALARQLGVAFHILVFDAPEAELRRRISLRKGDASEATLEVLEHQIATREPLSEEELGDAIFEIEAAGDEPTAL